jgi:hypothetical protein
VHHTVLHARCQSVCNKISDVFLQEYEEDTNSEPDVDLENQYYNSKAMKENDPNGALESFQKVTKSSKAFLDYGICQGRLHDN